MTALSTRRRVMLGIALLALGATPALAQDSAHAHPPVKDSAHPTGHGQHAPSASGEAMMHHSSGALAELHDGFEAVVHACAGAH